MTDSTTESTIPWYIVAIFLVLGFIIGGLVVGHLEKANHCTPLPLGEMAVQLQTETDLYEWSSAVVEASNFCVGTLLDQDDAPTREQPWWVIHVYVEKPFSLVTKRIEAPVGAVNGSALSAVFAQTQVK